ncbi:MAG: glycosyltransferase [Thermoanaerobaculia bacterium]|jgi:glycosyltransferase involved in cell wall biosynthesis
MRILLTNNTLAWRSGSELYVRDLAIALKRRGHEPMAFSPQLGDVADDLRDAAIPVTNDLRAIGEHPDVIHGQHHLETMAAIARFPGIPAVYVCHGFLPWQEAPPRHPRIRRHVAVDDLVRERLVLECGVAPEDVSVLYNFVDLSRFPPREPLPDVPRRALVFNGHATEENFGLFAREACSALGVELSINGYASGRVVSDSGSLLRGYDIVFARARSALEAMATGCAVIVADPQGVAGLVTPENLDSLRRRNFGASTLTTTLTTESLRLEIAKYDPSGAAQVRDAVRRDAAIDPVVDAYEEIYADALSRPCGNDDAAERDAVVGYLQWLSVQTKVPGLYGWSELRKSHDALALAVDALRGKLDRAERGLTPRARDEGDAPAKPALEAASAETVGGFLSRWLKSRR